MTLTLVPLDMTRSGLVMWPMAGASEDAGAGAPPPGGAQDGGSTDDGDGADGGDGSKDGGTEQLLALSRDLAAAKQQARARRVELKPWQDLARDTGLTVEQIRERLAGGTAGASGAGGQQPQVDEATVRRNVEAELTAKANRRIVRAEVKAAAAGTFEDPADAAAFLDLDEIEVDDDGNVDADEVKRQLTDLLRRKPHLAKRDQAPPPPDFDGGARRSSSAPQSMSELIRDAANRQRGGARIR